MRETKGMVQLSPHSLKKPEGKADILVMIDGDCNLIKLYTMLFLTKRALEYWDTILLFKVIFSDTFTVVDDLLTKVE